VTTDAGGLWRCAENEAIARTEELSGQVRRTSVSIHKESEVDESPSLS